jgi:hypothetical protein
MVANPSRLADGCTCLTATSKSRLRAQARTPSHAGVQRCAAYSRPSLRCATVRIPTHRRSEAERTERLFCYI